VIAWSLKDNIRVKATDVRGLVHWGRTVEVVVKVGEKAPLSKPVDGTYRKDLSRTI
jgi:hypothetical protein